MSSTLTIPQREVALRQLWGNRAQLSQAQWGELYDHVVFGLRYMCNTPQLLSLGDTREEYIQQFFMVKVYEGDYANPAVPAHFGALCHWFRNFLLDILKSAQHARENPLNDCDDDETQQVAEDMSLRDQMEQVLFESGLDEASVRKSASEFLASLEKADHLYLACHHCPDGKAEALSSLAQRMRIASYHDRALKLGITRKKGEFEKGYEKTHIGKWLTQSLGFQCTRDFIQEIFAGLKILCDESLKRYSHLCAGDRSGANHG